MKRQIATMFLAAAAFLAQAQTNVETQRQYISGTGCDDMVEWDFMCTGGRNSGKWTKIGVPSCWELQGFGTYQYGMRFYGKATPEGIADEKGLYKTEFTLPAEWEGREIYLVFEGSMTDTYATINGRKAGVGLHQGGFNRFMHNVSDRVFFGKKKNRLEVEVSKESADPQVNMAERRADFWNFGGIFRPVFIVSKPAQNIHRVAIDAGMDGRFKADCYLNRAVQGAKVKVDILDSKGKKAGSSEFAVASDIAKVDFSVNSPALWTAETPNLYTAVFTLLDQSGKTLHVERQKFGFRTIEIRQNDGVYINGSKVIFKGVNRHSFRPETGRTLSKQKNIEDVLLIKSMNMNSVRLGHYAADPEFLEACDSLGLYVENELLGWHKAVPTIVGQKLVESLVTRDVNHPSVIFWSNGNEGGFNYELEPFFYKFDPQKRVVLYPWANRNGIETKHYRSYG
ncbi:MAG: glycoside hydrolase family 2, partial [Prevotella sp.]|nr:glycoside hydrolase family 2 [Prevotella sp.]